MLSPFKMRAATRVACSLALLVPLWTAIVWALGS